MSAKGKDPELTEAELRRMLMERRSQDRQRRLDAFLENEEILPLQSEAAESAQADPLAAPITRPADPKFNSGPSSSKTLDRLLLAIEIAAIIGLIAVFVGGINTLNALNEQVDSLFVEAPSSSPTPVLSAVVLPSGHTAPQEGQSSRPNTAEIPAHLRLQVQSYNAAIVVPTPGPQQARRIQIDSLDISAPIVQGDDWESLKRGVGQHIGSANPGEIGNLVLSGHNDIYGEIFRHLDQLSEGDEILVHTDGNTYSYLITDTFLVSPTQVEVMYPSPDATLTLISCYPYLVDNQRIIIQASLQ
jgi:sortase A